MGEPPLLLHDWFAAVAPSTLAGDRELAIVLYGRVEANPGVVDDRPSALQLVKRLGTDAFRTGTADEARTVKLVGVLARERAVAAGVDEVVINTFKTGISPHYEFLLRAAREQKPHKVNLRAAFPPPARSAVPEPTPVQAPTPSRKPRSLTPSLLDLGSDYQRPAGAPGSMHELAEGLRRARQLRRPLLAQRVADKAPEPRTLPDRDAGWSPARKQPVEVSKEAPRNAADRSTPQLAEREHPVPVETNAVEEAAQPNSASRAVNAESSIPEVDKREVDTKEVSQPLATTKEQKSGSNIGEGASADVGPAKAPALVQIDCRPKSVKQALAVTVLRFFLGSKSEATAVTSTSAPASVAQRVPSQRTGPVKPEAIVAPTRPRRLSEPISRFQANMASLLSLSEQLSKQATEQAAPDASVAAPALAVQAPPEEIAADEAPMELDDKARDSDAEEHAQDAPVSAAKDDGTVEQDPAPAITDAEDVDMKAVAEPSSEAAKAAVVEGEEASEIEKVLPTEAATESAAAEPAILNPRPISLSRVEPASSDRHSSLEPMPIRSSQGFSSMYSDESDHEANDSADATAHEISAFLERDLASSVVDEDDFADRSERPPTAAEQEPETIPVVEAVAQAETGTAQAPPIDHVAEKSSPEHVLEASRPPPSPTAQPLERTAQHAANQAVAEPGSATPLQGEEAAPAPVSPVVLAAEASQAGSDSQRPASPLPETASSPRINHIPPETVSQVTPWGDELPTAGPSGSQEVSPGREADPEIDDATSTDLAAEPARPKSAEPVLQEAVESAPLVEPIATETNGSTATEERTSTRAGLTVQQQVDDDDTYYAPLEDKSMYFADAHAGEAASLDVSNEVKQEEAGPNEQAHLAAAAFESSFGGPFVYQGEISVEETFDPAAVEKVYANDPALQDDLDGITDRGVLEALAALRSSPAVSVTNETTPRQPVRKSGSKRTTPRRARSTRTSDSQSRAAPTTTPPVSNGVAPSAGSSPTKRRRPPIDDFILEIFPLKSPRSPKKRSQLEKRSEKRPESPAHVPVASTSKVTLDEPAADRSPPPASNEIPQAAPVKFVEPSVRASRSSAAGSPPLHVTRSASVERIDAGRRASNDYESDSDDPLAVPARPKKKRVSNGMPKQTAKRSRPLPERQSQLSEEESQDSDRAVARELLPAGRAPQRPAEPEAQVARPTPPPAKRRVSQVTDSGMKPEPKRPRTTPSTEPRRRPSLAGKGQPVQRRNGVPRIPPPPHGEISSPLPLAASRDGSDVLNRSAARTAPPSTGQSVHHGSRKRRHSDLVSPPLDDDDDDSTQDARPSHQRASVVTGHSETSKARTVPRSSQGRTPVEAPRASSRSVERTAAARDGNMRDRRPRPTTSSLDAEDGRHEIEEDEAEPVQAGEGAELVEFKTPAKARKRAKKRKPLNMPRYKGKKRATPRQQQSRPRSPTPEETPSPEPTPPPQQQQNVGAHAPAVKRQRKKSIGGGNSRGSSQRARQAYDEGEWEG